MLKSSYFSKNPHKNDLIITMVKMFEILEFCTNLLIPLIPVVVIDKKKLIGTLIGEDLLQANGV